MEKFIQPYTYNLIQFQANELLKAHRSLNDFATIQTMKLLVVEKILTRFNQPTESEKELLNRIVQFSHSQKEMDAYLILLEDFIIPFEQPSDAALKKLFRKTKKLHIPNWDTLNLADYTFYGWNDAGKQRKYLILFEQQKLIGIEGTLSPTTHKGFCAICHTSSQVSLFMNIGKHNKDGQFTSKGNYICHDSHQCNKNIMELDELQKFIGIVKQKE